MGRARKLRLEASKHHQLQIEFQPLDGLWGEPFVSFSKRSVGGIDRDYLGAIRTVRKAKAVQRMLDDFIAAKAGKLLKVKEE